MGLRPEKVPEIFSLGGYAVDHAIVVIFGLGLAPVRDSYAMLGDLKVGDPSWRIAGHLGRGTMKIEKGIAIPHPESRCKVEVARLARRILSHHPAHFVFRRTDPTMATLTYQMAGKKHRHFAYELFGTHLASRVLLLTAATGATSIPIITKYLGSIATDASNVLSRLRRSGILIDLGKLAGEKVVGLNANLFFYEELKALLLSLAQEYAPEFLALAAAILRARTELGTFLGNLNEAAAEIATFNDSDFLSNKESFQSKSN